LSEKPKKRHHFGDLEVNERMHEKRVLQKEGLKSGWHSSGSAAGCIESRHESSQLLKCSEFIEQLSDCQLLKKDCCMGLTQTARLSGLHPYTYLGSPGFDP